MNSDTLLAATPQQKAKWRRWLPYMLGEADGPVEPTPPAVIG